jgi:hypothetical protein
MSEVRHARRLTDMSQHSAAPRLDPARTWTVLVGVLEWTSSAYKRFPKHSRQDVVFDQTLKAWGVPDRQRRLLLDGEATKSAIVDALRDTVRAARPGDTVVFYYAGHGSGPATDASLAPYDADFDTRSSILRVDELASILSSLRSASVLLTADCCFSGALASAAAKLNVQGIPAAVLASVDGSRSTSNWTFTRALVDAFAGRAFVDHDGDGVVSLADVAREASVALRARDVQRAHASWFGLPPELRIAPVVAETMPPLGWCEARNGKSWLPSRVIGRRGEKLLVRRCTPASTRFLTLPATDVRELRALPTFPVGALVWATPMSRGEAWPAEVLAVDAGFHLVDCGPEWDSRWREWLPAQRLALRARASSSKKRDINQRYW